jgi:hypothetical protein
MNVLRMLPQTVSRTQSYVAEIHRRRAKSTHAQADVREMLEQPEVLRPCRAVVVPKASHLRSASTFHKKYRKYTYPARALNRERAIVNKKSPAGKNIYK